MMMKKRRIIVFASCIILMGIGFIYFFVSGNIGKQQLEKDRISIEKIEKERQDLQAVQYDVLARKGDQFEVEAMAYQAESGRMEVDICVFNPKIHMKNVIISGLLPEKAHEYLYTPDLLITNAPVSNQLSSKQFTQDYTIAPKIKSPLAISSGRSFYLNEDSSFEQAQANIKDIVVKCTWLDENDKTNVAYMQLNIQSKTH